MSAPFKRAEIYRWLRILVFLFACYFIYIHVHQELSLLADPLSDVGDKLAGINPYWIVVLFVLSALNWSLEAFKWKLLVNTIESVGFFRSLRAVFNGIAVSFFTPNRSGEFLGRILYVEPENRIKAALLSVMGTSSQLLVTIQLGLVGAIAWLPSLFSYFEEGNTGVSIISLFIVLLITWLWFNLPMVVRWTDRLPIPSSWREQMHVWDKCSFNLRWQVWMLSLLRYSTFALQQVIIYRLLGFDSPLYLLCVFIGLAYLMITFIPSIAIGELGIREAVNLFIFTRLGAEASLPLIAGFTMWFLNIVIPTLAGAVSFLMIKGKKASV